MAARAYWQGQIRLALVSIPVEIYTATKSGATIAFHQIHEPSGKRIKYEKVAPGVGAVDADEIVKGFEVEKGEYVLLEQDEIDAVKLESKKTLELTQFVDAERDRRALLREALFRRTRRRSGRGSVHRAARGAQAEQARWGSASFLCAGANMSSA
jgi:Ku protein